MLHARMPADTFTHTHTARMPADTLMQPYTVPLAHAESARARARARESESERERVRAFGDGRAMRGKESEGAVGIGEREVVVTADVPPTAHVPYLYASLVRYRY